MDTKSFHLKGQPAPEGLLKGVSSEGEFHEITQSASQVLLAGVPRSREIHLEEQCASEGLLEGVTSKGEFHEIPQSAPEALLAGVAPTGEIHLETQCVPEALQKGLWAPVTAEYPLTKKLYKRYFRTDSIISWVSASVR